MKKLFKLFKKLPPEMRMLLAMVGLASPVGAIYFLRKFTGLSILELILYVGGAIILLCLLFFLVSWLFSRGKKKRAKGMERDLSSQGESGPQSMDTGGDIKANREKFFGAIRTMRKDVGISVYDLPWYVVIGDSGCGKTKLINEAGLTFSTGKPEGYRLGTLNYNWWFTEDAIFIDMAGRLCNPQDDGDRREWLAFLDTVAKGRKGFPINGVLVCVSAEHLLQDAPEKHEADANTALERLRDLQTRLGVTFATYLLVTKCDKILGFMPFFDRAERDITIKNQMFGWSKPGGFDQLYDPEEFKGDFDSVYSRLHELRLRRLNDEAEEIDLGLAYSFPEEFRSLYDPLQIYVRTLFPYIKNPRAVKNLIFRGVYFTSATQEGGVILKHLTERLGPEAADQFEPLDSLYPNKRPHFIRDVLFRKVFLEHGLVFRNEQQVVRNKKLHQLLKVGTAVLTVILIVAFIWSSWTFSDIIGVPLDNAKATANQFESIRGKDAVARAGVIGTHARTLRERSLAALILSVSIGTKKPIEHLEHIRVRLVEKTLAAALSDIGQALRSGQLLYSSDPGAAEKYLAGLEQYIAWFGCRNETGVPRTVTKESFRTLCSVVTDTGSIVFAKEKEFSFSSEVGWYFDHRSSLPDNPARSLNDSGDALRALTAALDKARAYWVAWATLDGNHPDDVVKAWMVLHEHCRRVKASYDIMVPAVEERDPSVTGGDGLLGSFGEIETLEELKVLRVDFGKHLEVFNTAMAACASGPDGGISESLADALLRQRQGWIDYVTKLSEAASKCSSIYSSVSDPIGSLQEHLDRELWINLQTAGIVPGNIPYGADVYEESSFRKRVTEVYDVFPAILEFQEPEEPGAVGRLTLHADARRARNKLSELGNILRRSKLEGPADLSGETPEGWIDAFDAHFEKWDSRLEPHEAGGTAREAVETEGGEWPSLRFWRPDDLSELDVAVRETVLLGEGTRLLNTINARLEEVQLDAVLGFAELVPDHNDFARSMSPYTFPGADPPSARRERSSGRKTEESKPTRRSRRSRGSKRGRPSETQRPEERRPSGADLPLPLTAGGARIPNWATHDFLNVRALELADLLDQLTDMGRDGAYLNDLENEDLHELCKTLLESSARAYMNRYVQVWHQAYANKHLDELAELTKRVSSWEELATRLGSDRTGAGPSVLDAASEFETALEWILRAIPWATFSPDGYYWEADAADYPSSAQVAQWMYNSITVNWQRGWPAPQLDGFVRYGREIVRKTGGASSGHDGRPWATAADAFRAKWEELAGAIASYAPEATYGDVTNKIPWGEIEKLQSQYKLNGEKLTDRLLDFEKRAQVLLGRHLTRKLCDIQSGHFPNNSPDPGWPYRDDHKLETVDLGKLQLFLAEVRNAQAKFKNLDAPRAPGYGERQAFYTACNKWERFLWPNGPTGGLAVKLGVTVDVDEAMDPPYGKGDVPPDDGCQHHAKWCVLDFGFEGADKVLNTACRRQDRKTYPVKWTFSGLQRGPLRVYLKLLPDVQYSGEQPLGDYSPLAFCAYLESRGWTKDRSTWYVLHTFDASKRDATGSMVSKRIGQKLRFTLGRKMPEPIAKLKLLDGSRREGER